MKAFYDNKPSVLEAMGNGSYIYRWDIKEVVVDSEEGQKTNYSCDEVVVWAPLTAEKLKEIVLREVYGEDKELKLVNEYNSYQMGVSGEDNSEEYKAFLKVRESLKRGVDVAMDEFKGITRTDEEELKTAKEKKILDIYEYDNSREVNNCYISYGGQMLPYWADKFERNCLKATLKDCMDEGVSYYRLDLRDVGFSVTFECKKLVGLLKDLEMYAIQCFNRTSDHIFAVKAAVSVSEVESYDYKTGYPEKLVFEI